MTKGLNPLARGNFRAGLLIALFLAGGAIFLQAQETPASVRREVGYTVRDSVDYTGNRYIQAWSRLPSVLTFVNNDGSVSVCSSDESAKITYVYEYDANLAEQKVLRVQNELAQLGAFTKDADGNYYFFYAARAANQSAENMAMVKVNPEGEKIKTFTLRANPPNSFSGVRNPFDAGTCRLELSGSMLAVYFARQMFNGHQACYGFVLDKDSFERVDRGAAINDRMGENTQMPYVSHSFNQFILPVENGFVFADHGDAYPRSFTFAGFQRGRDTKRLHAFRFPGGTGANPTYAEMGGLAKTSGGYIFAGAYGKDRNSPRNIFVLTFDENLSACSAPVYLTAYTRENGHAGHPKIAALGGGRYLLLWEQFAFSTQAANVIESGPTAYLSTHALVINEKGEAVSETRELKGIRLNMNDTLRVNQRNGKVYWAVNDSANSITVYAF